MPIRITVVDGPEAGRAYNFPDGVAVVTVGRHPSCDVVFPADLISVSRYHLAFERKLARYRLVMQADNPVWIDGEEAFEGDELPAAALLALGHPDGPSLRVETVEDDDLPPTERYARHDSPARVAEAASRRSRAARSLVLVVGVLVVVAGAVAGVLSYQDRREMARLVDEMYSQPGSHAEESLAARLREASRSVYLVAAKDEFGLSPFGTAWVVGDGMLVTSAHVAEAFTGLGPGLRLVVRRSGGDRDIAVTGVEPHPDYRRFEDAWRAYGPLTAGAGGGSRPIAEAGGYDVALLRVSEADRRALAPPLRLAPDADLLALEPGDLVGYVGFPVESAALGGVNLDAPQAQLQIGRLTALTDFFLVKSDPADRHLLQHSLPVQGGASGAPVLDRRGQVVGVLSGGNLVEIDDLGTRVPTGVGVNFAQRADLVRELLSGEAGQGNDRRAYWQRRLVRYQNEVDMAVQDWAGSHGAATLPTPLVQADGRTAEDARLGMPAFVKRLTLTRGGWYLFLATSRDRANIDMMVVEQTAKGPRTVGIDASPDHYPGVEYVAERGAEVEIVVPGPVGTDVQLRVFWLPPSG